MAPALRMTRFNKEMQTIFFLCAAGLEGWLVRKRVWESVSSLDFMDVTFAFRDQIDFLHLLKEIEVVA